MERKILTYGGYFEAFYSSLDVRVQKKVDYGLLLLATEDRVPTKFVKSIRDGLFELRIEWEGNIYRVFFIFDSGKLWCSLTDFKRSRKRHQKMR